MADCENLLGLNNHDIQQYKESEQHYQNALIYVEKVQNKLLRIRILHNLGLLHSKNNNQIAALDYLNSQISKSIFIDKKPFQS